VVEIATGGFQAEVMPETVAKTNLASLRPGDSVNLERSLRLGDRLGGHLVTGHVDGVGRIVQRTRTGDSTVIRIQAPDAVQRYIVSKGSVAVDGISLTVAERLEDGFTISLIPHTARVAYLGSKSVGATVNLEGDIIGKYVERMLAGRIPSLRGLTAERLSDLGYIT
jgi:riboflavin synthase